MLVLFANVALEPAGSTIQEPAVASVVLHQI